MLKSRSQFLASLLFALDLAVLATAWSAAFALRFGGWPVPVWHGVPPVAEYVLPLLLLIPIWGICFRALRLDRPRLLDPRGRVGLDVVKATFLVTVAVTAASYFLVKLDLSRVFLVYFWLLASCGLLLQRTIFREALLSLRNSGHRSRRVLIIGTEEPGRNVKQRLDHHPELGLEIRGFLTRHSGEIGRHESDAPVLGHLDELERVLEAESIDVVFIALPIEAQAELNALLSRLEYTTVEIKIVPDLYRYALLRSSVEEFEGLPVLSLNDSPVIGWRSVVKRVFDLAVGIPALLLALPLIALIALTIRLSSGNPVFYRQDRMGLDGRTFRLTKFRTMGVDAEREEGPVWATEQDPRRTPIGRWLRRTSLDELPQLWHVIRGEMSLVGPRPERPVFIDEFRRRIPRYMLRHRVKAGMTGWAQVNGWRGNTSVEKRLDHDLHYIQNWSLRLDLKILWLTLLRGFTNRNAY